MRHPLPGRDLTQERFLMTELGKIGIDTDSCKFCGQRCWDAMETVQHIHEVHGLTVSGDRFNSWVLIRSYLIHEDPV